MSDSRPVQGTASFDGGLTVAPDRNDRRTGNIAESRPRGSSAAVRTRRARLRISRVDPWSVMKTSFLFSIAGGIMMWVAVYVIWTLLGASGMFEAVDAGLTLLLSSPQNQTPVRMEEFVNTNRVMGITALFAVVNVILLTALGTIFAFLYNLSANILGGLELTLAED
ncbi:MAG: DUF3566 domain-containing protein [Propionibacteriaceae bacterium]|nr:DUF3566 domain-containing protein [Propionibacteriaceae bacterium]